MEATLGKAIVAFVVPLMKARKFYCDCSLRTIVSRKATPAVTLVSRLICLCLLKKSVTPFVLM